MEYLGMKTVARLSDVVVWCEVAWHVLRVGGLN
jgi:hypothetical protein